jgi:hypothetical protein
MIEVLTTYLCYLDIVIFYGLRTHPTQKMNVFIGKNTQNILLAYIELTNFLKLVKRIEEDIYMNFCFELNIKVCCMHGGCRFGMRELVEVYVWRVQGVESGWKVMSILEGYEWMVLWKEKKWWTRWRVELRYSNPLGCVIESNLVKSVS